MARQVFRRHFLQAAGGVIIPVIEKIARVLGKAFMGNGLLYSQRKPAAAAPDAFQAVFQLTRKTPMEAGFAMPSSLIKCSDAVDSAVSRAINPDTRERYRDLGDFITDLDKAIANPSGRNAASIPPPSSSPAIPTLNMQKGQSNIYYYLIPALIVGIVLTYTCILYKKDVVRMRNDYNEQVQKENNAKAEAARQANRDARRHAPATAQNAAAVIPSPVPAARPAQAVPKVSAEPGKINWSLQPGVKVRQSSNRNMLGAYGPEKAVDGNTSSRISDVSISATRVVEGKTAWFGIDFGRETNRTIEKVVIYTPANLTLLGTMEKFKVILYGNDKNVLAEKTFSTTPSEKSTNVTSWKLDAPVKARALRVESANPSQPLALTEVEAYGPEDAEDTPVPAPAE